MAVRVRFVEPRKITVAEWHNLWFTNHRESLKARTRDTYRNVIERHSYPRPQMVAVRWLWRRFRDGYPATPDLWTEFRSIRAWQRERKTRSS